MVASWRCGRLEGEWDGSSSYDKNDWGRFLIDLGIVDLSLGIFLTFGTFISFLPQLVKIVLRKSHRGLSYWFLFLATSSEMIRMANITLYKLPQIYACYTEGVSECGDTMISLFQLLVSAICTLLLFSFYIYYFEHEDSAENRAVYKNACRLAWIVFGLVIFFYAGSILFVLYAGVCAQMTLDYAWSMGIIATAFQFVQLLPQLIHTYKYKGVGSVSVIGLAIQAPGGYMVVYFQAVAAGENWSTWISVLVAATMQSILLCMCLYYKYHRRGDNKYWFLDSIEEEDESHFDSAFASGNIEKGNIQEKQPLIGSSKNDNK